MRGEVCGARCGAARRRCDAAGYGQRALKQSDIVLVGPLRSLVKLFSLKLFEEILVIAFGCEG